MLDKVALLSNTGQSCRVREAKITNFIDGPNSEARVGTSASYNSDSCNHRSQGWQPY
jgi:hypothetical protein